MRFVLLTALFSLFCGAPSFAQNGTAVWVDTKTFFDSKNGIPELVALNVQLEREFAPLIAESEKLREQITKLQADYSSTSDYEKSEKLEEKIDFLSEIFNKMSQDGQTNYDRRRKEIDEFISKKLNEAMKVYAAENKYDIILDAGISLLYVSDNWPVSYDRTADFIQWYNTRPQN